jgi:hypothetical protein
MRRLSLSLLLLAGVSGCQKSDTETLSRIGRKVADRGQAAFGDLRSRIDLNWKPRLAEPDLEERVRLRLRYDKELGDVAFEVKGQGKEIELRGKVSQADHKRRAVELAETTRGVERVHDHIEVIEAPPVPPAPEENKMPDEKKDEKGEL